ncbi:uncharacterized protein LOC119011266 isoform X1 [Acanthopagrus latus]|uniref:uncharacterized protein LOC119011266 isoform X1 n=1 Tax=Acanthopagrus latus TaxID=8177 RepID=UPI00187CE3F2|nr:uncharacterized protein LOC119011266 isoform X1 [Acanthopagrus latus]
MACRVSGGSKILSLCLGLLLVASCHCTRPTKFKALDKLRINSTRIHNQAKGSELRHGRLLIGHNSLQGTELQGTKATRNSLDLDRDYQADMGWAQLKRPQGQVDGSSESKPEDAAVKRLLKMESKVECTGDSMKLEVQDAASTPGSLFFVDRGSHLSPLPVSKLPSSCGYTLRSTQKAFVLVAPYDGCFVTLEEDSYVLPLRWLGLPVKMSCPLSKKSSPSPPMVTCHAEGMVVKTEWSGSDIKVNLNGNWEPLMKASVRCGFGVVVHPEGVVVSVHYVPCLEKKDGLYTLELAGYGQTKISCPSLSSAQHEGTKTTEKYPAVPQVPGYPAVVQATKPTTAPKPPQPEAPQGQVYQSFYPQPKPEHGPETKPTTAPKLLQPEAPQGQVYQHFYPNPFYPQPGLETLPATKPTAAPKSPQPEAPQGQVYQSFYPQPENGPEPAPTTASKPPQPQAPQGQVYQPFYPNPFYPNPLYHQPGPETVPATKPTAAPKPPQPEAPQGHVYQSFYPRPQPEKIPEPAPKPPQPEAPQGQVYQPFYPNPFYPQPKPENGPEPAPKPPQPEAPQGQVYQPFYPNPFYPNPFYPQPGPETVPATKPTAAPESPQPEAPQGQVYQSFYPQPKPENGPEPVPKPPHPEAPQGQVYQPFYPNPFYPNPFYSQPGPETVPATKPTAAPESPQPEAPQGQVYQSFYPQPKPENGPEPAPKPPQPEAPQGQVYQPFYPNPLYPNPFYPQPKPETGPETGTETKPTSAPKPPQPEAPQGQVYQPFYHNPFYPNPIYPLPGPESTLSAAYYTAAPKPIQPQAPQGQVYQSFHPQPQPGHLPAEKPTAVPKPAATETSQGQVYKPYAQPLPGAGSNGERPPAVKPPQGQLPHPFNAYYFPQQPQWHQPATLPPATSKQEPQQVTTPASSEAPPEVPQSSSYMPPVFCPQFCPPGFSNCCPQIAFHQHLHHIVPAGPGSKGTPSFYTGLPFLPSLAYSGYGNGFDSPPLPRKTNEAIAASTSAPQSPPANGKQPYNQPPGGNPAAVAESNPSKPSNPEQQMYPYFVPNVYPPFPHNPQPKWQNDGLSTEDMNNPSGPNVSFIDQNLQQHTAMWQNKPTAEEQQPSNEQHTESNKHEQIMNADTGPKNYLLLPHGPPGREPNGFNELPLPFRYLGHETYFVAPNIANSQGSKNQYQNFRPPQENPQISKWLGKGNSNPLPDNVNNMPRPGDESSSLRLLASSAGPHVVPVPQVPSFSTAHANSKTDSFTFFVKPMPTSGPSQRIPPYVPGHLFQQWISAANNQGNGLNQPIQGEGGNPKQT